MADAATAQGGGANQTLVQVTVDSIETVERAPTDQSVTQWLERLWKTTFGSDAPENKKNPNLGPLAKPLAAAMAENGLTVPWPNRGVHLKELNGERRLWLLVGIFEADAMVLALRKEAAPRPLTHDLADTLLDAAGHRVTQAAVTHLEGSTFYATVWVQGRRGKAREIDARPSDALCLALRAGAPIYVAEPLLARAGPHVVRPDTGGSDVTARVAARLDAAAGTALDLMRQEAAGLGHRYLGTEHLLLGLCRTEGAAAEILARHGVSADAVRHDIAAIVGRSRVIVGETFQPQPGWQPGRATPRLEAVYERALEAATGRGHEQVNTMHLLLGLVTDESSLAAGLLEAAGAKPARLKEETLVALGSGNAPMQQRP